MKHSCVPLGELVTISGGGTPSRNNDAYWSGSIPWATVKDLKDTTLSGTQEKITPKGLSDSASNLIPAGSVIVATRMGLGKVAVNTIDVTINQDLKAFSCCADLEPRYLLYFLLVNASHLDSMGKGATVKGITLDVLKDLSVPLPPLPEQKRIAAMLDKADSVRRKRQEAVRLTEELLRSVFLDMFGDPVTNPKGWGTCCLGDVIQKIESGWSPVCEERHAEENEWGVLKLGAVTTCRYLDTESKALPTGISPRPDMEVKAGDLLFTRKNTYDLVAASALVYATRPKLMLSDLIFRLKLKDDSAVISEYLWALLSSAGKRKQIQSLAGGSSGSMPNISKSKLMEQMIEVPPIALQKKYANILHGNYRIKNKLEDAIKSSDTLFNSLLQRAFKGEL